MIYRDGNKMIYDTGEFPKGMKDVLTICKTGKHPDKIGEELMDVKQLAKLEQIEPDPAWRTAFGMPEEEPAPVPVPKAAGTKRRTPRRVKKQAVPVVEPEVDVEEGNEYIEAMKVILQLIWGQGAASFILAPLFVIPTIVLILALGIVWIANQLCPNSDQEISLSV